MTYFKNNIALAYGIKSAIVAQYLWESMYVQKTNSAVIRQQGKSETYFRRYDIMRIMDKDNLPEWAVKSLAKIKTDIHREER